MHSYGNTQLQKAEVMLAQLLGQLVYFTPGTGLPPVRGAIIAGLSSPPLATATITMSKMTALRSGEHVYE